MRRSLLKILIIVFSFNLSHASAYRRDTLVISLTDLRIERMAEPMGVEAIHPQFSWQIKSNKRAFIQSAYDIMVASSLKLLQNNIADVWNSGKVASDKQNGIELKEGKLLQSGKTCYWKVRIWDKGGTRSKWSETASWTMGILAPDEWHSKWITYDTAKATAQPLFRKAFMLSKPVKRAIAHISGLGYYELFMNGAKVGDHVLDPALTNYDDYALYATYDITKQLNNGSNVLGAMLGDGWYNQNVVWDPVNNTFAYGKPLLICQVKIEYADGTTDEIVSDESWQWTNGPVIKSNVYAGETYDACKEIPGWCSPGKPQGNWMNVKLAVEYPPKLIAQKLPPIKEMAELTVKKIYKLDSGGYVFDLGQNFAGWARIRVKAPAGTHIIIKTAEEMDKDGKPDFKSTGVYATHIIQTEDYTCKGSGTEIWEPRFTYHGFRYAEVSGIPYRPDSTFLKGIIVYSSVTNAGDFACSNEQINRLHKLANWTLTSNLHSFITDCPHREKGGWLGDAHAVARMAIYNHDMENFLIKYIRDIRSSARVTGPALFHVSKNVVFRDGIKPAGIPFMIAPGKRLPGVASVDWGTAYVQLPWYVYLYYGNENVLREFYPNMKQWVEYCRTLAKDNIIYEGLGDWCPPGTNTQMDCPVAISSTAFYYYDISIMAETAAIIGHNEEEKIFKEWQATVKKAFNDKFFDSKNHTYGSQTADAMALEIGLVPDDEKEKVSDAIVVNVNDKYEGFMHTGIFGLPRLFGALSRNGNEQEAFRILTKKGDNSFETMWKDYNATTLWEILPVKKGADLSTAENHPMQAGFDQWFYEDILGIRPDVEQPGFKKTNMDPYLTTQLHWAKGTYKSVYGTIKSEWSNAHGLFKWIISVPANTTALIHIPAKSIGSIKESGVAVNSISGIRFVRIENKKALFEVGSGNYVFTSKLSL
ncbi:MAG: hypothetical protein JWP78_2686 [Mucilaginibacter sp.]|nr:hypothetical protein [Mucilaginibacter sp.]